MKSTYRQNSKFLYLFVLVIFYISFYLFQNVVVIPKEVTAEDIDTSIVKNLKLIPCGNIIGVWIKNSVSGIGTMTYYNKATKRFGALGHGITNANGELINPNEGILVSPNVVRIKKGEVGSPGELVGSFIERETAINGKIDDNRVTGIYGIVDNENIIPNKTAIPIALKNEIKEGKAKIYSNIISRYPKEYEIEIERIYKVFQIESKSMLVKITDQRLIDATGGIIQGMSGSPIIQNGKLVGAITHVLVNNPKKGYAINIESMLKENY